MPFSTAVSTDRFFSYNNLHDGQKPDTGNILEDLEYRPLRSQKEQQP